MPIMCSDDRVLLAHWLLDKSDAAVHVFAHRVEEILNFGGAVHKLVVPEHVQWILWHDEQHWRYMDR